MQYRASPAEGGESTILLNLLTLVYYLYRPESLFTIFSRPCFRAAIAVFFGAKDAACLGAGKDDKAKRRRNVTEMMDGKK